MSADSQKGRHLWDWHNTMVTVDRWGGTDEENTWFLMGLLRCLEQKPAWVHFLNLFSSTENAARMNRLRMAYWIRLRIVVEWIATKDRENEEKNKRTKKERDENHNSFVMFLIMKMKWFELFILDMKNNIFVYLIIFTLYNRIRIVLLWFLL